MAVFSSFLFNRTLKQFLACKDINSKQGKALIQKIRSQADDSLEKILEVLPSAPKDHARVLKKICQEHITRDSEDRFLDLLENDETVVRSATKSLLSQSQQVNPVKLFKRLHEKGAPRAEIIDILEFQRDSLPPELFIKNAMRLNGADATRLIDIAQTQAARIDMSAVTIETETLNNPDIKIRLIRLLAAVNQAESARQIMQFLGDESKIIVIEALKNLSRMTTDFDPSPIALHIPAMREDDAAIALKILHDKMSGEYLASLTGLMTGKAENLRKVASEIIVTHVTEKSLESFLVSLDRHEWWGKEQAIMALSSHGNDKLYTAAAALSQHTNEFVRSSAEQLAMNRSNLTGDLTNISEALFNENWQVRESAIETVGNSNSRSVLTLLNQVVDKYPQSSVGVMKAVRKLGFSKGLEIASKCMKMKEAAIQREALLTFEAVVTQRHAEQVRNAIVKMVPKLQATVRDTALEVIKSITKQFNLKELDLDEDQLFETRLLKIEENQARQAQAEASAPKPVEMEKTEVVSFQNIEELKQGDFWMDRFKIQQEIGRGAMGRVMLVEDETVGETLILKFMHPELTSDGKARERFLRELKYSRKISHPNVIRIHDFLVKDGISAISMEYFKSRGLDYMIKHELLGSHEDSLKILLQVSDGMFEAHQKKVIHRDLKPSNILVNDKGVAKVVDFGIASVSSESEMTLTKTGMIIGTPAYLSPERAKGMEADLRSDIYALGIIAYNMFNYGLPYSGEPMSLLFQHIEGKATPLDQMDKGISPEISRLVQKMMAVDIEARFQSMKEIRDSIASLL